jgi:pyridoxamine 5'-phosphate oxidase
VTEWTGSPEPPSPDRARALDLAGLRRSYAAEPLLETDLAPDPVEQFRRWFAEVSRLPDVLPEPNAMVLATADEQGRPSARTVLLKGLDDRGFVLFTNHGSRKGQEALANPFASLVFPWIPVERQVVVVGAIERLPREESAAYFRSRPRGSQLGAWASRQSTVVPDRAALEEARAQVEERFAGQEVPLPDFWGGFRVVPETVEFWHGRPDRLHDRLRYRRADDGWVVERLSP